MLAPQVRPDSKHRNKKDFVNFRRCCSQYIWAEVLQQYMRTISAEDKGKRRDNYGALGKLNTNLSEQIIAWLDTGKHSTKNF